MGEQSLHRYMKNSICDIFNCNFNGYHYESRCERPSAGGLIDVLTKAIPLSSNRETYTICWECKTGIQDLRHGTHRFSGDFNYYVIPEYIEKACVDLLFSPKRDCDIGIVVYYGKGLFKITKRSSVKPPKRNHISLSTMSADTFRKMFFHPHEDILL